MISVVHGRADGHELVLTPVGSEWQATLPPNLTDGQYVVTLTAADEAGNVSEYRGVLYLCAGICRLEMQREIPAFLQLLDNLSVCLLSERWQVQFVRHRRCST